MTGPRKDQGLTLVEVLVAMVLISVLLVPAINALQTASVGAAVHEDVAASHFRLKSRLEWLTAESFADLEASATAAGGPGNESSYSDASGPPARLLVFLASYDGDNADADNDVFTGADPGLLWIRVTIEGSALELQTVVASGT